MADLQKTEPMAPTPKGKVSKARNSKAVVVAVPAKVIAKAQAKVTAKQPEKKETKKAAKVTGMRTKNSASLVKEYPELASLFKAHKVLRLELKTEVGGKAKVSVFKVTGGSNFTG